MATEYPPKAIASIYGLVKPHVSSMENSGIVGNGAHSYGYHRSRNRLISMGRPGDYSIADDPRDKLGDGNAASAIDMKFSPSDMRLVSNRLIAAGLAKDPRLVAMREFFGTVNGRTVTGYSPFRSRYVTSSDISHLWHVHISITRQFCNDYAAMARIAQVIVGVPLPAPPPPVPAPGLPELWLSLFLEARQEIRRPRTDPPMHKLTVLLAERALADFGFAKGPKPDGHYGTSTVENCIDFQNLVSPGEQNKGVLGPLEWTRLAGGPGDGKHGPRFTIPVRNGAPTFGDYQKWL